MVRDRNSFRLNLEGPPPPVSRNQHEVYRQHVRVQAAYRVGDVDALRDPLDNPPDFPNCRQPFDLGVGDHPLEYAIYWRSLAFIEQLIEIGAYPN
jgi:hypothetical protein